jgi:hypothetical protein
MSAEDGGSISCDFCGVPADPEASEYTLISDAYGWRLIRKRTSDPNGVSRLDLEWACPDCWKKIKASQRHAG